ncbi:MAG: DEAD/DEAH box helicase [Xanthomonadales bacterium]|nr:DEAD/DEAH box helicase [Xanthomonadales bacterium]
MTQKQTNNSLSDLEFSQLELDERVKLGLKAAKFVHCTPIQALTLPVALKGADVAGQAQTGTGKTAAFLLVLFQRLLRSQATADRRHPRALVLAPTRELAIQIHKDALLLGAETGLKLGLAYGGVDYEKQRQTLEDGVDILVGTPGRIIDFFKQNVFKLNQIEVMVLDEADRMFDLGFIADIRYVLRRLPPREKRQCLLFSATLSYRVLELAYEHMNEPELMKVESERVTSEHVSQTVYYPANEEKPRLLAALLKQFEGGRIMVFTNTRAATDRVERTLNANGFHAAAISGSVPQKTRQNLLRKFHDGEVPILVATDVAARGLHIPDVTHVINYDLPQDAPDYVHRIGRTARLGAKGEAISFACENYAFHLPEIESFIGYTIPIEQMSPDLLPVIHRPPAPPPRAKTGREAKGRPKSGRGSSEPRKASSSPRRHNRKPGS